MGATVHLLGQTWFCLLTLTLFLSLESINGSKTVLEVLEDNNLTDFLKLIKQTGWYSYLNRDSNDVTVFAPTNKSYRRLSKRARTLIEIPSTKLYHLLSKHLVLYEKVLTNQLLDGEKISVGFQHSYLVNTRHSQNGSQITWVNGKQIITPNIAASNGVVHIIDGLLISPTLQLHDFLHHYHRYFGAFTKILHRANVTYPAEFTVFAPTNGCFRRVDRKKLISIFKKPALNRDFIYYHIIPKCIFLETLSLGPVHFHTLGNKLITVTRYSGNNFTISTAGTKNIAQVISSDLRVKRGVINSINNIILPVDDQELTVLGKLEQRNEYQQFTNALTKFGFADLLNDRSQTFTLFVPNEKAFKSLPTKLQQQMLSNETFAKEVLQHHILKKRARLDEAKDYDKLESMSGYHMIVRKFGSNADQRTMVDDAVIEEQDIETGNGIVHFTDSVFIKFNHTAWDIVCNKEEEYERPYNLSIIRDALKITGLWRVAKSNTKHRYIFFLPTNKAFMKLAKHQLEYLMNDLPALSNLLRYHVVTGYFHSNMKTTEWVYVYNSQYKGERIRTRKLNETKLIAYNDNGMQADVIDMDVHASNGLLHVIDTVLVPRSINLPDSNVINRNKAVSNE